MRDRRPRNTFLQCDARAGHLETVLEKAVEPLRSNPLVTDVRSGAAFMVGVQLDDRVSAVAVADTCVERGVVLRAIHDNTLQICPPFVVSDDEVLGFVK
jgi:adenosylmethionine-8-amino-7-oxononanoate aminotransferase